uniref:Uncharacterized protein n=1 Tax=Arundo donax TaxID=35708 RepID=A0A0A9A919_ARUDO
MCNQAGEQNNYRGSTQKPISSFGLFFLFPFLISFPSCKKKRCFRCLSCRYASADRCIIFLDTLVLIISWSHG